MAIQMIALTSFLGVEGLVKAGHTFQVRDKARADYLESVHFAKREENSTEGNPTEETNPTGENPTYQTQEQQPSNNQAIAPSHIGETGPMNAPSGQPEEYKAPEAIIQGQDSEGLQQPSIAPADLTVSELKERAKAAEVTGYSKMNKSELIAALYPIEEENT